MDINQLIADLQEISQKNSISHYKRDRCAEAATALSTLQAENARLRYELEQVKRALAMMWYAYDNKDGEFPHEYEIEAMQEAENVLGPWAECMPKYLQRGPQEG